MRMIPMTNWVKTIPVQRRTKARRRRRRRERIFVPF